MAFNNRLKRSEHLNVRQQIRTGAGKDVTPPTLGADAEAVKDATTKAKTGKSLFLLREPN